MAPKSTSSSKAKAASKAVNVQLEGPMGATIEGVMKAGYSFSEAERMVDQLWSEGLDMDQTEIAIQQVISRLCNQKAPISEQNEVSVVDNEIALLEQRLQQVVTLPNINDVLDGLIRWYNSTSPVEQRVLTNGDIIHSLLLRMLQTKTLSVKTSILSSFFKTVFCVSSDVSVALSESFLSIAENLPNLPLKPERALLLFERILHNLGGDLDSEKSTFMRCVNMMRLIEESRQQCAQIEGDDPKSVFMRRDHRYKSIKLEYDLLELSAVLKEKSVPSITPIDLSSYLTVPADMERVLEENQKATAELAIVNQTQDALIRPIIEEQQQLKNNVNELKKKREALLKELEQVDKQLETSTKRLTAVSQSIHEKQNQFKRQEEALVARVSNTAVLASRVRASMEVVKHLTSLQEMTSTLSQTTTVLEPVGILEDTLTYVTNEEACIDFLEKRALSNKKEAEAIASSLQTNGYQDDSYHNAAKLRRSIANDMETVKSLRHFAQGIERACSAMLTEEFVRDHKELVISVYLGFYKLRVEKTLSDAIYSLFKDDLAAVLPKPVVSIKKVEKKKEIPAEEKHIATGKKWGAVKKMDVKSMKEIRREEMERKC